MLQNKGNNSQLLTERPLHILRCFLNNDEVAFQSVKKISLQGRDAKDGQQRGQIGVIVDASGEKSSVQMLLI